MVDSGRKTEGTLLALLFLAVAAITVVAFKWKTWLPPVASVHGHGVDRVIDYLLVATGIMFVAGHLVLAFFVWAGARRTADVEGSVSTRMEWLTALAPVLILAGVSEVGVMVMGLPVWAQVYGEPPADALRVEMVGRQFNWTARYPGKDGVFGRTDPHLVDDENMLGLDGKDPAARDDIVTLGPLTIPANRPIFVQLRSHDVIHSFSVVHLRVKQDVVPGLVNHTRFVADTEGTYEIGCAQVCGLGHYRMRGFVHVVSPADFETWLSGQSPALDQ
ncbi:MAG: cytochrome c oxidase subunit II [Acidobacteriota bacterium]